ncbi:hypothetical protein BGW36DRAFT_135409 [Talaromyces proteolyticus]|uniref:Uncharacterized protein n=1 Tax=Talaromyces proteolyticus TaxID=1131652 RepID=A0AAD4KTV9_9EURO|nr:uncharacterized protein BGW36DRAFT_135409 [Talaromyces proteolyticus]KAH8700768.1 hypothetical protein BGW36DRAFT_135409 [Talaromyces proteolyticus]
MMNPLRSASRRSGYALSSLSPWRTSYKIGLSHSQAHGRFRSTTTSTASDALPRIAQTSLWTSIIPRFIRDRFRAPSSPSSTKSASQEWNPATFYIVIFLLIGSQAIQMLLLRKDYENYNRKTDAKIRLLNEVIQRVKNGENVDVEKLLGTGEESKEREWEEEIEEEDSIWHQKARKDSAPESAGNTSKENKSVENVKEHNKGRPQEPILKTGAMSNIGGKGRFY